MSCKTGNRWGVVLKLTVEVSSPPPPPPQPAIEPCMKSTTKKEIQGMKAWRAKAEVTKKNPSQTLGPYDHFSYFLFLPQRTLFFLCLSWPVVNSRKWLVFPSLTFSLSVSKAEVASSRSRICGLRTRALAMAILCFCPPEIKVPLSPTRVS